MTKINELNDFFSHNVYELYMLALNEKNRLDYISESTYSTEIKSEVFQLFSFTENDKDPYDSHGSLSDDKVIRNSELEILNLTGKTIDDSFVLEKLIYQTGNSAVYIANRINETSDNFNQKIAVKVLLPIIEKIMGRSVVSHEAQLIASCKHNNIVKVFNSSRLETDLSSYPCLLMEYIDGKNILEYVKANNSTMKDTLSLFQNICEAIQYLHSRPIIHGDLKHKNILVDEFGSVKIIDFTLGCSEISSISGYIGKNDEYSSPEQNFGNLPTIQSDIYALGVILKELLLGGDNDPKQKLWKDISIFKRLQLKKIYQKSCELSSLSRYETVENLSKDIYRVIHNYPISIDKKSFKWNVFNVSIRRPLWVISFTAFIIAILISYSSEINTNKLLLESNNNLTRQISATEDVALKLSSILNYTDIRYRKGEAIDPKKLLQLTESTTSDQNLPDTFKLTMAVSYGDVKLGNGNISGAIRNYEKALNIAESIMNNNSITGFSKSSIYSILSKLISAYISNFELEKARAISKIYLENIHNEKDISKELVEFIITYLRAKSTYVWENIKDQSELTDIIRNFINDKRDTLSIEEKTQLTFKYATLIYYGFNGDQYSITDGVDDKYINEVITPAMIDLKYLILSAIKESGEMHHLNPELYALLAKVSYELGDYESIKRYGNIAISNAEKIYRTKNHPAVLKVYLKYFSAMVNVDVKFSQIMIDQAVEIENYLVKEGKTEASFASGLRSGSIYFTGNLKELKNINEKDKRSTFLEDSGNNWSQLIYVYSFPEYSEKTMKYVDIIISESKWIPKEGDLDLLSYKNYAIMMKALYNNETIEESLNMSYEELFNDLENTYFKPWHYLEISLILAQAKEYELSLKFLDKSLEVITFNSREILISPEVIDFYIMVAQVYYLNNKIDKMWQYAGISRKIITNQKMSKSVHNVFLNYLELAYYREQDISSENYLKYWKATLKGAKDFGYKDDDKIVTRIIDMKYQER
jgi:serine/threonine protein kinase